MRVFSRQLSRISVPVDGWCIRCESHRVEGTADLCPSCVDVQRLRWEGR